MTTTIPVDITDPVNARILAVSEDTIGGFHAAPFQQIAAASGVDLPVVLERIEAMLRAGTIRRVRQTLLATNLAEGALVAWSVPQEKISDAFDWMFQQDPFSGHVVLRSTDGNTPGAAYRLWTTVKVPQGCSLDRHCAFLARRVGATAYRIMPAKKLFALGVGHVRRRGLEIGSMADAPAEVLDTQIVTLSDRQWQVLAALKRDLAPEEVADDLWQRRAAEAGVPFDEFCRVARDLDAQKVIGRFSTFLEHVKPLASGERVTRFNALFHWAVPPGQELQAGREVGRFHIMTHAYWREGGNEFANVNIMGVAHGLDKQVLLEHKAAIDRHLQSQNIPVHYTNVFWGGRSEIKPSEIVPAAYRQWCRQNGLDQSASER